MCFTTVHIHILCITSQPGGCITATIENGGLLFWTYSLMSSIGLWPGDIVPQSISELHGPPGITL
jgi:hypothetical protein